MTDPAAEAARAAAVILAPDLGPGLPAEVEAALYVRENEEPRRGHFDFGLTLAAATLIVTIAQLAWSIYSDRRRREDTEPTSESVTREVRISLHEQQTALPDGTDRIAEVVVTEVIRLGKDSVS